MEQLIIKLSVFAFMFAFVIYQLIQNNKRHGTKTNPRRNNRT